MIVRILGEGQFELDEAERPSLEKLDAVLDSALGSGDEAGFAEALVAIQSYVRERGRALDATVLTPSELALPAPGSTIAEVQTLLDSEQPGA